MKGYVALWAAVSVLVTTAWLTTSASDAVAQQQPVSASGDTLKAGTQESAPPQTTTPPAAPTDTLTAAARIRRAQSEKMTYVISLGLGTSINRDPPAFPDEYDPSAGIYLAGGVRRWGAELSLSLDYNFFFSQQQNPEDMNVLNVFANLKYLPLHTTARPYVVACAGYFRSWIVDPLDPNDPPQTVVHEVESGDNNYEENVFGYGYGVGVEVEIDKTRRIFFEGRWVEGQTRETQNRENMVLIPTRVGLTWEF